MDYAESSMDCRWITLNRQWIVDGLRICGFRDVFNAAATAKASEYARFYKCDLQVQTPEDPRNWNSNDPVRAGNPRDEADLQDKARQFH